MLPGPPIRSTGPLSSTHYQPLPIENTVEVWVADSQTSCCTYRASTRLSRDPMRL